MTPNNEGRPAPHPDFPEKTGVFPSTVRDFKSNFNYIATLPDAKTIFDEMIALRERTKIVGGEGLTAFKVLTALEYSKGSVRLSDAMNLFKGSQEKVVQNAFVRFSNNILGKTIYKIDSKSSYYVSPEWVSALGNRLEEKVSRKPPVIQKAVHRALLRIELGKGLTLRDYEEAYEEVRIEYNSQHPETPLKGGGKDNPIETREKLFSNAMGNISISIGIPDFRETIYFITPRIHEKTKRD